MTAQATPRRSRVRVDRALIIGLVLGFAEIVFGLLYVWIEGLEVALR